MDGNHPVFLPVCLVGCQGVLGSQVFNSEDSYLNCLELWDPGLPSSLRHSPAVAVAFRGLASDFVLICN